MKVLLEILDDASQLLAALDRIDDLRPETHQKLKVLLEGLCEESTRLLRDEQAEGAEAPVSGERFERRCREWLLQRSLEALAAQNYDRALEYLEQGVETFPEDPEFSNHLGLVHWEMGDYAKASQCYAQAMAAAFPVAADGEVDWRAPENHDYLRAMEGRALTLCRLNRHEEALPLFDALANMNVVDYDGCRYMAGEIRHMTGDIKGAIEDYRLGPVEPASLYNLALAQFTDGQTEASAGTFIRAFVSNIHVFHLLSGRQVDAESCVPGYLGSRDYAGDFVHACADLWEGCDEAVSFMETCFDHPLVEAYLAQCQEDGGDAMLEHEPAAQGQASWLDALMDQRSVAGLAESVVKRFNS
ncbi:tetratricopeptide repeat protein [Persicimonas caeni]|uniref:Tetratricopeptide repeat protein n=1 Tax=Persicimonas caeni TaxID=2292766 RepID=A0A4Y6Q1Q5_PERCE|nr:tetratricopeptide repeat protein [Persicimonas caeni]QDG54462.1 tetratricopeptide repeat protein [Persicimonas caeni]QED35683.1 tetratricopeptide repeat protein [Persicimonas caeni]